jgi:long-subunit fatty acid transport protein
VLYPTDPAVLFGSVSLLYSPARRNVTRQTDQGTESLGTIAPGLIFGFNFGMGLALNERTSFSVGYDHSSIGKTLRNGAVAADSVQLQLGTLLFGLSYRLDDRRSVNVSVGAGLTRDTPDVSLSLRVPTSF